MFGHAVHVDDCLQADVMGAGRVSAKENQKWSTTSCLTFLHQQKCYTFFNPVHYILVLIQHCCFHYQPYRTINHFPRAFDICWWIDLFCCCNIAVRHCDTCSGRTDPLKLWKLRQFMVSARQKHISEGFLCTGKVSEKMNVSLLLRWNFDCSKFWSVYLLTAKVPTKSSGIKWLDFSLSWCLQLVIYFYFC